MVKQQAPVRQAAATTDHVAKAHRRPGRPSAEQHANGPDMWQELLRQAKALFMQRGFADVSVAEIAAAAGVSKPTLYYHFGDKEGLYTAVLCDMLSRIGGYIRSVTETDRPIRERLYEFALGYFRFADATIEPMLRDTSELLGPERAKTVWEVYAQDVYAPIRRFMSEGIERGELGRSDPDMLVTAFLALLNGFTAPGGHTARSDEEHQRVAAQLTAFFMCGAMCGVAGQSERMADDMPQSEVLSS